MKRPLGKLLAISRRIRLAVWASRARTRMRWVGISLDVEAGPGVVFVRSPYVLAGSEEPDGRPGSLRIRLGRRVRFAPGVVIEAEPGRDSLLEIGDGTRIGTNVHIHLRGGVVRIAPYCEIRDGCVLKASGGDIEVGELTMISYGCVVHATERVAIGDRVALSERVTLVDSQHAVDGSDVHWTQQPLPTAPIVIGSNSLLYANVVATMGARIGANSQVAAGSLVREEYPPRSLLAGVPARVVREL